MCRREGSRGGEIDRQFQLIQFQFNSIQWYLNWNWMSSREGGWGLEIDQQKFKSKIQNLNLNWTSSREGSQGGEIDLAKIWI